MVCPPRLYQWILYLKHSGSSEKRLNDANVEKKYRQIMLQKMTSNDIFMHFTNLHLESWPCNAMESISVGNLLSGAEQSEIVCLVLLQSIYRSILWRSFGLRGRLWCFIFRWFDWWGDVTSSRNENDYLPTDRYSRSVLWFYFSLNIIVWCRIFSISWSMESSH